jgi:hypothetical protein
MTVNVKTTSELRCHDDVKHCFEKTQRSAYISLAAHCAKHATRGAGEAGGLALALPLPLTAVGHRGYIKLAFRGSGAEPFFEHFQLALVRQQVCVCVRV